jgi:dihydroorotate dehydrogenase
MTLLRRLFLRANDLVYRRVIRRILFRSSAQDTHEQLLNWLARADQTDWMLRLAEWVHRLSFSKREIQIGGVTLNYPFIVAAGLVKGQGFPDEPTALSAVEQGKNIIPGWLALPTLVGAVEFGSFTRHPRLGNPGTVIWRFPSAEATQNRVGLKNPGVVAAAEFLRRHKVNLPPIFGINIAVSPGVEDDEQSAREISECLEAFISREVLPTWFTLNISCPNTEDDPGGNQTEARTRLICRAAVAQLRAANIAVPLWVKLSPNLARQQYDILMRVFVETGVRAVIATNTLPMPSPDDGTILAGVAGGLLHSEAVRSAAHLMLAQVREQYPLDVIGCGGVLNGDSYMDFKTVGIEVVQYWSALVFRGPLAAPIIESEFAQHHDLAPSPSRASAAGD